MYNFEVVKLRRAHNDFEKAQSEYGGRYFTMMMFVRCGLGSTAAVNVFGCDGEVRVRRKLSAADLLASAILEACGAI